MSTTTRDKPKPGSELIREQAQYWRERAAMCLDNTPKTEREYKTKTAALNATADAYDAMLAACESMVDDIESGGIDGEATLASYNQLKSAIALAKPK